MSYNLRSASYVGNDLDQELAKYGARTSGSTERKVQRLRRFVRAEKRDDVKNTQLEWTRKYQRSQVQERELTRATELVFEGVRTMILEKGRDEAVPEILEMLMRCPPDVVDRVRHCLYDGKNGFVRDSASSSTQ